MVGCVGTITNLAIMKARIENPLISRCFLNFLLSCSFLNLKQVQCHACIQDWKNNELLLHPIYLDSVVKMCYVNFAKICKLPGSISFSMETLSYANATVSTIRNRTKIPQSAAS